MKVGDISVIPIDGVFYVTAKEIRDWLHENTTYRIPVDNTGQEHPGTIINRVLIDILAVSTIRNSLLSELPGNGCLYGTIDKSSRLNKEFLSKFNNNRELDVYWTGLACKIIQILCKEDVVLRVAGPLFHELFNERDMLGFRGISINRKKFNRSRSKSLLASPPVKKTDVKVIDMLTEQEQDAVRKYNKLVKETRVTRKVVRRS